MWQISYSTPRPGRYSTSLLRLFLTRSAIPTTSGPTSARWQSSNSGQAGRLRIWVRGFIRSDPTDTLSLLKDLSLGVAERIAMRAARLKAPSRRPRRSTAAGVHAGILQSYLPSNSQSRIRGAGRHRLSPQSEPGACGPDRHRFDPCMGGVYVPGAGWITFDPTNRSVGGFNLIPVAVVRDIGQAMPVSGSFIGLTDAFMGMSVEVSVTS